MRVRRRKGRAAPRPALPASPLPRLRDAAGEWGLRKKRSQERQTTMPEKLAMRKLPADSAIFAAFAFAVISAPGFMSDPDRTIPGQPQQSETAA